MKAKAACKVTEITPEMIGAGVAAYVERCPDSADYGWLSERVVSEIYRAMITLDQERIVAAPPAG
jgi:hypothetical protein